MRPPTTMPTQRITLQLSADTVARRAGGRRHYNALRRVRAALRRHDVLTLIVRHDLDLTARGTSSRIASALGVHRSTVFRDVQAILADLRRGRPCPCCGVIGTTV